MGTSSWDYYNKYAWIFWCDSSTLGLSFIILGLKLLAVWIPVLMVLALLIPLSNNICAPVVFDTRPSADYEVLISLFTCAFISYELYFSLSVSSVVWWILVIFNSCFNDWNLLSIGFFNNEFRDFSGRTFCEFWITFFCMNWLILWWFTSIRLRSLKNWFMP